MTLMETAIDLVLRQFYAALDEAYGQRLERVVLFGSRTRGDARADSDYDVAVFLQNLGELSQEADTIASIEIDIPYDTGAVINAIPFRAGAYFDRTGLMQELRREGVDLLSRKRGPISTRHVRILTTHERSPP